MPAMETAFSRWISTQLGKLMKVGKDDIESISSFVSSMEHFEEINTFLEELLGGYSDAQFKSSGTSRQKFFDELRDFWNRFGYTVPQKEIRKKANTPVSIQQTKLKSKKKSNYVPLYGKNGELHNKAVMLPGRHSCECQAQKHK